MTMADSKQFLESLGRDLPGWDNGVAARRSRV